MCGSRNAKCHPANGRRAMTSRDDFERSLGRTAANLPGAFVDKAVGDMRRRCELLSKAKGGFFEEGGRARRPL